MARLPGRFAALLLLLAMTMSSGAAQPALPGLSQLPLTGGTLQWGSTGEWELENQSFEGNPFDLVATVTFAHPSAESVTTEMFYAGEGASHRWRFRFAATRLGQWTFSTSSADPELDGHRGNLIVAGAPYEKKGRLATSGDKLVVSRDNGRHRLGVVYNVFVASQEEFQSIGNLPKDTAELTERVDYLLDETDRNGFNSFFVPVNNSWFSFGARSYEEHDSVNPDPFTFLALETFITRAQARGMYVHVWAWGDERRRWTPKGVGGINGEPDRRLQRYIAARLAPLPGWTMSYGFDLEEWVRPEEVRSWAEFLHERSGWPPILMAREFGKFHGDTFELGDDKLDVFSTDDRPKKDFYELAVSRLGRGLPVLFERRFVYRRDGVWDQDTTRRAMWQFAMAGGAGSIWGIMFDDPTPYPKPEQFRIHRRFWEERLLPDMTLTAEQRGTYLLADPDWEHLVFYDEDARQLRLDLSRMQGPRRAVAVDTRAGAHQELELGELRPGEHIWTAPYESDWAIAVGY